MSVSVKQIEAIMKLTPAERYDHFVKVVCDTQEVWSLYSDGWVMSQTDDGTPTFPVWPRKEYAELNAVDHWADFEPRSIELSEFLDVVIPELTEEGGLISVFPVEENAADATNDRVEQDIRDYLNEWYG